MKNALKVLITLLTITPISVLFGQESTTLDNVHNYNLIQQSGNGLAASEIMQVLPSKKELIGDFYYDSEIFQDGSLQLVRSEKSYDNLKIRYNLETNNLECLFDKQVKYIESKRVKEFTVKNEATQEERFFINSETLKYGNTTLLGFVEVLANGELSIAKRKVTSIAMGHYVPQLGPESKNDKVIKKEYYYIIKGNELIELPKRKKEIMLLFTNQEENIKKYMKEQSLKLPKDIGRIASHYNSVVNP